MKKLMIIILALVFVVAMNGCAVIWSKSEYDVSVKTNSSKTHKIKFTDVARRTEHFTDYTGTANDLKSYGEKAALGHKANMFQIIVEEKDEYPCGVSYIKATVAPSAFLGFMLGPGAILTFCIDSWSGCLYNLPESIFIDMELMKEAKNIAIGSWKNSDRKDAGIIIMSPQTWAFLIPKGSDKSKELKKVASSANPSILTIESKGIKTPFKIFNGEGNLVCSGISPSQVSVVNITDKFFVVFHIKDAGFLVRVITANPRRATSLYFKLAIDPENLRELLKKYRKNPKSFYDIPPTKKK
jgi:uncharacterized protein YxeA